MRMGLRVNQIGGNMSTDKKLDVIFREVDELCHAGKFKDLNEMLREIDVEKEDLTILIGYLTITSAAKRFLHERKELYRKVFHRLVFKDKESAERIYGLLSGLS